MTDDTQQPDALPGAQPLDEPSRPDVRDRLRALAIDVTPLRESPTYRRLWFGEAVSFIGTQMTAVAVPVQVYELTRSNAAVGLLGLTALVPLIVFGLLGGSIADAKDRRRTALVAASGLAVVSVVLLVQSLAGFDQVWLLYLLVAVQSALFAIDSPTRRAIVPRLVRPALLPAAMSLGQVLFNFGVVVGPVAAGTIMAGPGVKWVYALDVVSFAAALWAVRSLPPLPPSGEPTAAGWRSVGEGLRFLRRQHVVLMTFVVDLNAMIFGMPRALFPAIGASYGGPRAAGLLYSAPAVGALVAALLSGWATRVRRQGVAVLVAVAGWGAAIVLFGLSPTLWLAVFFLALAGAADMVSAVFRNTMIQVITPDDMRGRMGGVFLVIVAGGPRLGDVEAGVVAELTSPAFSVVSGGVACLVGVALLAALSPRFARYDAREVERAQLSST